MKCIIVAAALLIALAAQVRAAEWYIEHFGGHTCLPISRIAEVASRLNLSPDGAVINAPVDMANMFRRKGAVVTEYNQILPGRVSYKVSGGHHPFDIAFDDNLSTCQKMEKYSN